MNLIVCFHGCFLHLKSWKRGKLMKAMFVNEDGGIRYAQAIVQGYKPIETRKKNMLSALVGERVAVVRTRRGKSPSVVGFVDVVGSAHRNGKWMNENRDKTLIPPGSKYDCGSWAKWCYFLENPEACEPFPLPDTAIRHGRSWCEF